MINDPELLKKLIFEGKFYFSSPMVGILLKQTPCQPYNQLYFKHYSISWIILKIL
jgi:hypothetical protein